MPYTVELPGSVGVPLSRPGTLMVMPPGRKPPASSATVNGAWPDKSEMAKEYGTPTWAGGTTIDTAYGLLSGPMLSGLTNKVAKRTPVLPTESTTLIPIL